MSLERASWTTAATGVFPTDSTVRTYNGGGTLLQQLTKTNLTINYYNGTAYDGRNPINPISSPGKAKLTISVGKDNDGFANCTMTFFEPGALQTTTVTASNVTSTSARVNWTAVSGATGYYVERDGLDARQSAGDTPGWGTTDSSAARSRVFDNLIPGKTYTLSVTPQPNGVKRSVRVVLPGGTATPAPTPTPSPTTPIGTQPNGPAGTFSAKVFEDNFDGTSLSNRWARSWFNGSRMNDVATSSNNVSVANGVLTLTLSSSTTGALVSTNPDDLATNPFQFGYGYAEARVYFPGNGSTIYNWPAWWTAGQPIWPANGEIDVAEGLGMMTTNYHGRNGSIHSGQIPGTWSNSWHTYGVERRAGFADIYFDGVKVKTFATSDNGAAHYLILNVGNGQWGGPTVTGAAGALKVDHVRVWRR